MRYLMLVVWLAAIGVAIGWLGHARAEDAAPPAPPKEVSVPGANTGGILDWVAVDDTTLLVQDGFRNWYRVRLHIPSRQLAFAQGIRFLTGPSGALDNTSQLIIRGQRFPVASVTASAAPPRRKP